MSGPPDAAGVSSRLELMTDLRGHMHPKRNNSVVNAASPAPERFVLPLFPPASYFVLFPVPSCGASGEQRSHQNRLTAGLFVIEF
jgi:hypothetical protein